MTILHLRKDELLLIRPVLPRLIRIGPSLIPDDLSLSWLSSLTNRTLLRWFGTLSFRSRKTGIFESGLIAPCLTYKKRQELISTDDLLAYLLRDMERGFRYRLALKEALSAHT